MRFDISIWEIIVEKWIKKGSVEKLYLDRFPGPLHKVSPLLKLIITESELPRVWLHDTWASQGLHGCINMSLDRSCSYCYNSAALLKHLMMHLLKTAIKFIETNRFEKENTVSTCKRLTEDPHNVIWKPLSFKVTEKQHFNILLNTQQ